MSSITEIEKLKLETILEMGGGYVLSFSNQSLQNFVKKTAGIDIYDSKYAIYGDSKAKRLRALWEIQGDYTVGKLLEELLLYHDAQLTISNKYSNLNKKLFEECLAIAYRLQKKPIPEMVDSLENFLKKDVDETNISSLQLTGEVTSVIEQRIIEVKKSLKTGAALSVVFLCGSILEGVLLGMALRFTKIFNQADCSPKDKESGKVKHFQNWTLANLIDVAFEVNLIGLDVKKFSHTLRDFRNYIHPFEQVSSKFNPDGHTAEISWKVLKAALHDISENSKKL